MHRPPPASEQPPAPDQPAGSPQPNIGSGGIDLPRRFWLAVAPAGLLAGLAAGLLMLLLRAVQHLAWSYGSGEFLNAVEATPPLQRVAVLALASCLAGLGGLALRRAIGGHGGELTAAIWFQSGRVPLLYTVARGTLSIVIVGLGASLGREGAPKQIGAAIASALCDRLGLGAAQRRLLVACGAGAGMAAVYNVPLGGALFALEVLLGTISLPLVLPAVAMSAIATATSHLLLPDRATYSIGLLTPSGADLAWSALVGPVAGLGSAVYVRLIALADGRRPQGWRRAAAPLVMLTALGLLAIPLPGLLGNGKDLVERSILGAPGIGALCLLLLLKPLVTAGCLGSGSPGGLFTPSLAFGALLGALCGQVWAKLSAAATAHFAILGAGAVLAATTQGPLSAIVLMLELVHGLDRLTLPLLVAVILATLVARAFERRSIYSARIHLGRLAPQRLAVSPPRPPQPILSPVEQAVSAATPVAELLRRRPKGERPRPLYVVDADGRLLGEIPAATVLAEAPRAVLPETTTAADLAVPTASLDAAAPATAMADRLQGSRRWEMPVVDVASGRLTGVAVRRKDAD